MMGDLTLEPRPTGPDPEITVLVPTYQMRDFVGEAVESALLSTFKDLEVIVVDDGSTDGTGDALRAWTDRGAAGYDPRLRYVRQSNQGKSAALNRGLDVARGRWLTILDADDVLLPDGLARRHALATDQRGGREADLVIGGFEVFESGRSTGRRLPSLASSRNLIDQFCFSWRAPYHLNACLLSRDIMSNTGRFDPDLRRSMDLDYLIRLLGIAQDVRVLEDVVFRYRKYRSTFSERFRYRRSTATCRTRLLWKNLRGIRRPAAVTWGLAMDVAKTAYEARGNWGR